MAQVAPNSNRVVRREKITDAITRVYYADGGSTDICVTNDPYGVMNHFPGGATLPPKGSKG